MTRHFMIGAIASLALAVASPAQAGPPEIAFDGLVDVEVGYVVAGVDGFGRVLIAVDHSPEDGAVDEFLIYSQEKKVRRWSVVGTAVLTVSDSEIDLLSETASARFRLQGRERFLARDDRRRPRRVQFTGFSIVRRPGNGMPISEFDPRDSATWPAGLQLPLLLKRPQGGHSCDAGGYGSTQCGKTCGDDSCTVTCSADYYPCCYCEHGIANCKCVRWIWRDPE